LKNKDNRTHPYAVQAFDFPQDQGNYKQVRQAAQYGKDSTAAGGENERGLGYMPKGLNARVAKPTEQQFKQWREEEPGLLRRLQNGDERAAEILAQRYRWWLQVKVGRAVRKVSGGLFFGDVFSCALVRFLECLKTFRPGSNNGLRAYLEKAINGAISDAQQEWQSKGFGGFDTRLRRFLRAGKLPLDEDRNVDLEKIQKLFPKYTLHEIAATMEPIVHQNYTEGSVDDCNGYQDDDEHNAPSGYAVAVASSDPVNAQRSTSSQWSKQAASGRQWPKENGQRNVFAYQVSASKRKYGSPWIDLFGRHSTTQDAAFFKLLGPQKFTEWKMAQRSTANTGDWDENGNWRATEQRRLKEDGPSSRATIETTPAEILQQYRHRDYIPRKESQYGSTDALRRPVHRSLQRAG
jgi:hypothetical protein